LGRVALVIAIIFFIITCFYAYRAPISFVFLIPAIMAAFVFTNQNHGGEGFLGLSSISACLIFLLLTNAQTPIFGEAYELRKQRVKLKMKLLGNQRKKISNS
jgi:hypothetical protein